MKKKWLALLLCTPLTGHATLIEWVGTGPQTYYWDDQANPTAQITIRAHETGIEYLEVTNTHTTFSFENPDLQFYYSESLGRWGGQIVERGFAPDAYPGGTDTLLNTLIGWHIYGPKSLNPFTELGNIFHIGVGTEFYKEFEFVPETWTKRCVAECGSSQAVDVPEPGSLALAALGLLGIGWRRFIAFR